MLAITFALLAGVFLLIVSVFFVPPIREMFQGPQFLVPFVVFSVLGGILVFFTLKKKIKEKERRYLLLTGSSAAGLLVSVLLHNFLYAAEVLTSQWLLVSQIFGTLHAFFFLVAIIVCPICFLIGTVGSIALFLRK